MGPLAAAVPFIQAGLPLLGGLFGKKNTGPSKMGQNSLDMMQQAQGKGMDLANTASIMANPLLGGGSQSMGQGSKYFQELLSGNRGRMNAAIAPEMDEIGNQFQGARTAMFGAPRGGGRTSALAQLPGQEAAAKARFMMGIRPGAAQGLLGAGQAQLGAGSSLLNAATQGLYAGTNAGKSILDYDLQAQEAKRKQSSALGGGIFDFVKGLPGIFAGGGMGGSEQIDPPGSGRFA